MPHCYDDEVDVRAKYEKEKKNINSKLNKFHCNKGAITIDKTIP